MKEILKKSISKVLISLAIIFILLLSFFLISKFITNYTGFSILKEKSLGENEIKECFENKEIILYINSENPSEEINDLELIKNIKYIKIVNCFINPNICEEKEINSFPTWIINKEKLNKEISFEELSEFNKC